jgi:hypothetical protein
MNEEFGLEGQGFAGDADYLGYDDDDYGDDLGDEGGAFEGEFAGYYDDDPSEMELAYNGADMDGVEGEGFEVGRLRRFRRGPGRFRGRRLRAPRRFRGRRRPVRRRAPRPLPPRVQGKRVIKVEDDILILYATSSSAGSVSDSVTVQDDFWPEWVTFDGSSANAAISSLQFHRKTILGPFSGNRTLPASSYTASANQRLKIKGNHLKQGQVVTLNGTIASGDDVLKCILHGKRRVFGACG